MDIIDLRKLILAYCYPDKIKIGNVLQLTDSKNRFLINKLFVYAGKNGNIVSMIDYNNLNKDIVSWYYLHHLNIYENKFKYIKDFGYELLKYKMK